MTSSPAERFAIVRRWFAAFNRDDVEALVELYDEDCVNDQEHDAPWRGREELRRRLAGMFAATAAWAAEAAEAVAETAADAAAAVPAGVVGPVAEAAAAVPNPGNNAWMMTATVLVLLMILPGLALFYGGLTRSKNMLSTMTQVGATAAMAMVVCWSATTTRRSYRASNRGSTRGLVSTSRS